MISSVAWNAHLSFFLTSNLLKTSSNSPPKKSWASILARRALENGTGGCWRVHASGFQGGYTLLSATQILAFRELQPEELRWTNGFQGIVLEAQEIAALVEGELVQPGCPGSICTDSRKIQHGEWFLALVGPNFDGHSFLQDAMDRGCAGAIGNAVPDGWPCGFVRVKTDTLACLQNLGAWVRRKYAGVVVGITGSTGKTTARAMTALALESLGIIHQTEGNLNNHLGVPLTLLRTPSNCAACVLELGMNHAGEILKLSEIAQPSVRLLLNVGPAHLENFGGLEDVAAAKGELLIGARPGDLCVLNADDALVMALPVPDGVKMVLFLSFSAVLLISRNLSMQCQGKRFGKE